MIEALEIGNLWNVVANVTVGSEKVRKTSAISVGEGVVSCGCLSNRSKKDTEHGRGEAIIVVGGVLGVWTLNRECGWTVQVEDEKSMVDSSDIWISTKLSRRQEHTGRKARRALEMIS